MRRKHGLGGLLSALSLVASVVVTSGFACELPSGADHMAGMAMANAPDARSPAASMGLTTEEAPAPDPAPCGLPSGPSAYQSMVVCVIDTGFGIPTGKRDIIFEEFSRLYANDRAGAGLGLGISKRLAEALGGQITAESDVGRGSTFTLRLPIHAPDGSGMVADTRQGRDERRIRQATSVKEPERRLI